jgi:hypothetical protein
MPLPSTEATPLKTNPDIANLSSPYTKARLLALSFL